MVDVTQCICVIYFLQFHGAFEDSSGKQCVIQTVRLISFSLFSSQKLFILEQSGQNK